MLVKIFSAFREGQLFLLASSTGVRVAVSEVLGQYAPCSLRNRNMGSVEYPIRLRICTFILSHKFQSLEKNENAACLLQEHR